MYSQFYVNFVNITHLEQASALSTLPSVLLVLTLFGKVPSFTLEGHIPLCKGTARGRGVMNHSAKGQGWTKGHNINKGLNPAQGCAFFQFLAKEICDAGQNPGLI